MYEILLEYQLKPIKVMKNSCFGLATCGSIVFFSLNKINSYDHYAAWCVHLSILFQASLTYYNLISRIFEL